MTKKLTTLEHVQHIVNTQNRVNTCMMVSKLPKEDQQASNKYIMKKTRVAIKAGTAELISMGVNNG